MCPEVELLNSHSLLNPLHSGLGLYPATAPTKVTSDIHILKYSGQFSVLILIYQYYLMQYSSPLLWLFTWLPLGHDSLLVSFYFASCPFSVFVGFLYSRPLNVGVPQGLVLNSLPQSTSLLLMGNFIYSLGFKDHLYMDGSQIYISFSSPTSEIFQLRLPTQHLYLDV